jgi:hypothetical protein
VIRKSPESKEINVIIKWGTGNSCIVSFWILRLFSTYKQEQEVNTKTQLQKYKNQGNYIIDKKSPKSPHQISTC